MRAYVNEVISYVACFAKCISKMRGSTDIDEDDGDGCEGSGD